MPICSKLNLIQRARVLVCLTMGCLFIGSFAKAAADPDEPQRSPASLGGGVESVAQPSELLYNGETLISADLIENYNQVQARNKPTDGRDFIPLDMTPTDNQGAVLGRIADKSLNTMLNAPEIRNSGFGQTANSVQNSMKQEFVMGPSTPGGVNQKFNFQLQAFQSLAEIKYEGYANAAVSYHLNSASTRFELIQKLPAEKELVMSHELRTDQQVSNVCVRWKW